MADDTDIRTLSGHLIVCGLGHVGWRAVGLLARLGERGVVITKETRDEWRLDAAPSFPVLTGDARRESILLDAGIGRARGIIVATNDDQTNVSIALAARRLNPGLVIVVRMFDQELAAHLERSAQIDRVLSTSALSAPAFAAAALGENMQGTFELDGIVFHLDGRVPAASSRPAQGMRRGFAWRALCGGFREWWRDVPGALRATVFALLAIVIFSVVLFRLALGMTVVDSLYFVITTVTTTGYGDYNLMNASPALKLYGAFVMLCGAAIIATLFGIFTDLLLSTRFRDVMARGCATFRGHVVVVGLGNIGFRLTRELVRCGETVVAVERREDGEFVPPARQLAPVVIGNAKTEEILLKAGLAGAKAVIAVTDDDMVNLGIGLAAKRVNPGCRVVLRMFDSELASRIPPGLGADAILEVASSAIPTLVGSALARDVRHGILFPDRLALIFRRRIPGGPGTEGGPVGRLAENESVLFVKTPAAARYESVPAGYVPRVGDEILGVRWCPLRDGAGGR